MSSERRKFRRFDVSLDVAFKTSEGSDDYSTGVTKNISRSGLCFESQTLAPSLKEYMELKVKLPDQDTFVSVSGSVAWKEKSEDKCWVGIEFKEIDKEAKGKILDYAYDLWVDKNRNLNSMGQ